MRHNRRMLQARLPYLFDELEKIAGDLVEPAVVANSAAVDGPPAKPFTRLRGYRKLEENLAKEAGLGKDLRNWRRKAQVALKRTGQAVDSASIKAYQKMPAPVQQVVTSPTLMEPSDPSGGIAIRAIKSIVGGG